MTKHYAAHVPSHHDAPAVKVGKGLLAGRSLRVAFLISLLAVGIALSVTNESAIGQGRANFSPEEKVKAVYLYNFTRYVRWPTRAFDGKEAPFVIGILEDDPHGRLLDRIAATRKAQGRSIVVKRFATVAAIGDCHLVFLNSNVGEQGELMAMQNTKGKCVLLIGDSVTAPQNGIPIRFFHDANGTIGLQINVDSMSRRELKADAKLLNIATIVRG